MMTKKERKTYMKPYMKKWRRENKESIKTYEEDINKGLYLKIYDMNDYKKVMNLRGGGLNIEKISQLTKIPSGTVRNWVYEGQKPRKRWTRDKIIKKLQELSKKLGHSPSIEEVEKLENSGLVGSCFFILSHLIMLRKMLDYL